MFTSQRVARVSRVLVVASDATAIAPVCAELMRRGAACAMAGGVQEAAEAARATAYDSILVHAREGAPETLLLLQLIKSRAQGNPHVLLLVDPEQAATYSRSVTVADAMVASSLAPATIAEAAGIVPYVEEPQPQLPALIVPDRSVLLALPAPLSGELLPEGVRQQRARGERPDVVVLTDVGGLKLFTSWMPAAAAAVVPVIDVTGRARHRADVSLTALTGRGLDDALRELEPMIARVRELPESFFRTRDARSMLMARLAVRERPMTPKRDPSLKTTMRFFDESAVAGAPAVAEGLARSGHMSRKFFDRLHACPSCQSSRLNVREECVSCHSADIVEEPIIHHLRCGYQGPERDFKTADDRMVCPKCRHALEHFSVDYDKPASLFLCNDCGQTTGDAAIGFVCMDCEARHDAEAMSTKAFYSYELTETGREAAFAEPVEERGGLAGAGPVSVRDRLREFTQRCEALALPYSVLMIRLDVTGAARAAAGERLWRETVALYGSILRELFKSGTEIVELGLSFLIFVDGESREKVEAALPDLRNELEKSLTVAVGARYDVLGADQVAAFM